MDEIQEVPRAIQALKYFCEECPGLAVAAAGSSLGIELHRTLSGEEAPLWLEGELLRFLDLSLALPLLTAHPTMAASPIIEQPTLF